MRRRTFVGLTGVSLISVMLAEATSGSPPAETEALASVLTGSALGLPLPEPGPPDARTLAAEVDAARGHYQACRYARLAEDLPGLLRRLNAVCAILDGDARDRGIALSADAHHVAAGLMLKHGDPGLAHLPLTGACGPRSPVATRWPSPAARGSSRTR